MKSLLHTQLKVNYINILLPPKALILLITLIITALFSSSTIQAQQIHISAGAEEYYSEIAIEKLGKSLTKVVNATAFTWGSCMLAAETATFFLEAFEWIKAPLEAGGCLLVGLSAGVTAAGTAVAFEVSSSKDNQEIRVTPLHTQTYTDGLSSIVVNKNPILSLDPSMIMSLDDSNYTMILYRTISNQLTAGVYRKKDGAEFNFSQSNADIQLKELDMLYKGLRVGVSDYQLARQAISDLITPLLNPKFT